METTMKKLQMVDLKGQYKHIKEEVDQAIKEVLETAYFIGGPKVAAFQKNLESYLNVKHVIPCANGTDALQIALMALDLKPGDEVIVPSFTYVATAEVIGLLHLKPVMVEVDTATFNTTAELIEPLITDKTKAIIPVHLFGQCSDMEPIMALAKKHGLFVIEDNAQAIGAIYTDASGNKKHAGTIGHIGCTSFFPSKNLGCYGDGGAMYTNDDDLAAKLKMIASHGQSKKYHHKVLGCNSRLDALQAAVLDIKLGKLNEYISARQNAAAYYDNNLKSIDGIETPERAKNSSHVFHQYTMKIKNGKRDELKEFLNKQGIPSMVYYPIPLYRQEAFEHFGVAGGEHQTTELLCKEVLSLPMHTELSTADQDYILDKINEFFK